MIQNPLVSVIIPVYNTQDNIIRCLESVCNQTYSNLEVIVIDDGSTDDSLNVINRIAANDKRIVVLHQSNQGAGSARNYGLLVSKGDFLGFVDSDDYISLDMMETMLNKMLIHNASIVECGFIRVDSEQGIETRYPLLDRVTIGRERCCKEYLLRENTTNFNWNKLYKSEIFSDVCFPELKYSEDYVVNVQAFLKCEVKVTISDCFCYYCVRPDSVTSQEFNNSKLEIITAGEMALSFIQRKSPELASLAAAYLLDYGMWLHQKMLNSNYYSRENERLIIKSYRKAFRIKYQKDDLGINKLLKNMRGIVFYIHPRLFAFASSAVRLVKERINRKRE